MNLEEAMAAAKKARFAKSKLYDVPELGGQLRFAPALAGAALENTAAYQALNGSAPPRALFAQLLASGCINEDGSPFFKNEKEATDFLGAISLDTMNFMIKSMNSIDKPVEALPKGNSETSPRVG